LDDALDAVSPCTIEEHTCADDIRMDKIERRIDAAIDM
jgi:hypothetical protein